MTAPNPKTRRSGPSRTGDKLRPVRLRMSAAMAQRMTDRAEANGLTDGAYVRALVGRDLSMDDPADLQPVQRYGGGGPSGAALMALRLQLRQTSGLLTQGAKEARLAGIPTHPDLEEALAEVKRAIGIIKGWQAQRSGAG